MWNTLLQRFHYATRVQIMGKYTPGLNVYHRAQSWTNQSKKTDLLMLRTLFFWHDEKLPDISLRLKCYVFFYSTEYYWIAKLLSTNIKWIIGTGLTQSSEWQYTSRDTKKKWYILTTLIPTLTEKLNAVNIQYKENNNVFNTKLNCWEDNKGF